MAFHNYTQSVVDDFLGLIENGTSTIWDDLGNIRENITAGTWVEHYQRILDKYRISSRFALMRILFDISTEMSSEKVNDDAIAAGFTVEGIGTFPNITSKHAQELTEMEVSQYEELLNQRVSDFDPDAKNEATPLIVRALSLAEKGRKTTLNRDEILFLAHALGFNLGQAQFMLLRVLGDNEMGLQFGSSMDLIDIYGFIKGLPSAEVQALKDWYVEWYKRHKIRQVSYQDKPVDWTQEVGHSFEATAAKWNSFGHEEIKEWLKKKAPYLDLRSKTALKVFRNMASYAYDRGEDLREAVKYADEKNYCNEAEELLFENGIISECLCEKVADGILELNRDLVNVHHNDRSKLYVGDSTTLLRQLYVDNGVISVNGSENKGFKNTRKRMADILVGEIDPTKGDMLLLVWFIAGNSWYDESTAADNKSKAHRLIEFIDAADAILKRALLAEFYPVNVLEQSMMMSIVMQDGGNTPAMIYDTICASFTKRGKTTKTKGSRSHTTEEKIEIVRKSYEMEGTVSQIAKSLGVSKASLNNWRRELTNGKLL